MNSQRFSTMSQNWSISPDEMSILKDVRTQNCGRNVLCSWTQLMHVLTLMIRIGGLREIPKNDSCWKYELQLILKWSEWGPIVYLCVRYLFAKTHPLFVQGTHWKRGSSRIRWVCHRILFLHDAKFCTSWMYELVQYWTISILARVVNSDGSKRCEKPCN